MPVKFTIRNVEYEVSEATIIAAYNHPLSLLRVGPHLVRVTAWLETHPPQVDQWDLVEVPGEPAASAGPSPKEDLIAFVRCWLDGPPSYPPGSLAAGSTTEDNNRAMWKEQMLNHARVLRQRADREAAIAIVDTIIADFAR